MPRPKPLPHAYARPDHMPPHPDAYWRDARTRYAATTRRPATPTQAERVRVVWTDEGLSRQQTYPLPSGLDPRGAITEDDPERAAVRISWPTAVECLEQPTPRGATWRAWLVILEAGRWVWPDEARTPR